MAAIRPGGKVYRVVPAVIKSRGVGVGVGVFADHLRRGEPDVEVLLRLSRRDAVRKNQASGDGESGLRKGDVDICRIGILRHRHRLRISHRRRSRVPHVGFAGAYQELVSARFHPQGVVGRPCRDVFQHRGPDSAGLGVDRPHLDPILSVRSSDGAADYPRRRGEAQITND